MQVIPETDGASYSEGKRNDDKFVVLFADGLGLICFGWRVGFAVWLGLGAWIGLISFVVFAGLCAFSFWRLGHVSFVCVFGFWCLGLLIFNAAVLCALLLLRLAVVGCCCCALLL